MPDSALIDKVSGVILDAFSRKVVGWELDRTLAARLPIATLEDDQRVVKTTCGRSLDAALAEYGSAESSPHHQYQHGS